MQKIATSKADKILIFYILRVILSTIISILALSFVSSRIIYKLDLDLNSAKISGIVICSLCAVIISYVSVLTLKSNGLIMGAVSTIPLVFYSCVNTIFTNHNYVILAIKLIIILLISALVGYIKVNRNNRIKV